MPHLKAALLGAGIAAALLVPAQARAASSKACDGGAFAVTLGDGSVVKGDQKDVSIAASRLGGKLLVRGTYVTFGVDTASFAALDYTFTGAPNRLDMTGGRPLVAFASKVPDNRGLNAHARPH